MAEPAERCSPRKWLSFITVEPVLTLHMLAFSITSIVEQAFFVDKACRVDHGYNGTICDDITNKAYEEFNKEIQVTVSKFHQLNDVTGHIVPLILAFFIGAWSDKRGRKIPLMLGLVGKLYLALMIIVNAYQKTWSVYYVAYTATIPSSITGADVAIFACAFTYLIDITSQENRTMRVTILEVCYLASMPIGTALGSLIFTRVANRSFEVMFAINAVLILLALLYTLIFLKYRTNDQQRPVKEANNIFTDFFDLKEAWKTIETLIKRRPQNRRSYLILMLVALSFYVFQRDEKNPAYLYFQLKMQWTFEMNSNFRTYVSALQDVFLLLAVPFMSKFLHWKDASIMIFGTLCHSIGRVFYATARVDWLIYLGGAFVACGPVVAPVIRSITSKLVPATERGKAFALLAIPDSAILLFTGYIYNEVYKQTIHTHPESIFYVTIATQLIVCFIAIYVSRRAIVIELDESGSEQFVDTEVSA